VPSLTPELRAELQSFDTPTVCNALEALVPARRGYGYTTEPLFCARPGRPPFVGLARTASIRSAHPSDLAGKAARELSDAYYAYIDEGPKPCVVVIHDMDERRGYGSFWGEVNSAIHKGLGCEGVITDGAVRDLPDIAEGFQTHLDRKTMERPEPSRRTLATQSKRVQLALPLNKKRGLRLEHLDDAIGIGHGRDQSASTITGKEKLTKPGRPPKSETSPQASMPNHSTSSLKAA